MVARTRHLWQKAEAGLPELTEARQKVQRGQSVNFARIRGQTPN